MSAENEQYIESEKFGNNLDTDIFKKALQTKGLIKKEKKVCKLSERQFLIGEFVRELATYKAPFIAFKLSHIPTKDLYFLLSVCNDEKNRGRSFSWKFFSSIKMKKDFQQLDKNP